MDAAHSPASTEFGEVGSLSLDEGVITTLKDQLRQAREQITRLQEEVARQRDLVERASIARRQAQALSESVQRSLQEGLIEVLTEEDEDRAEWLKEFLDANTPWEFSLNRAFRVRLTVEVTVQAASEDEARDAIEDVEIVSNHDGDVEVDSWTVDSIDED